jgi:hypothetical protein
MCLTLTFVMYSGGYKHYYYMVMILNIKVVSHHQNVGQANISFENTEHKKYWGMPITNQNYITRKSRLKKFLLLSVLNLFATYPLCQCLPNLFAHWPFWLWKITTDPQILAHVNTVCPDHRYTKLKIYNSKLMLDCQEYITVPYVAKHCMIWP